jgi:hypothetical protein
VLGFGDYENDNRCDLAGVDIDGDGVSEIAVIKRKLNGRQMLKVFRAPTRRKDQLGPVIVSDSTFGNANKTSKKTHLAGVDVDGDGIDEIAVIEESLNGRQKLKIFQAPTAPGGQTGPPIASDLTFGNVNKNTRKIDLAGVDMDGDGIDEIAVIQQALNGKQALRIFSPPTTTDGETGPCIASYNRFGNASEDTNKIALTNVDTDGDGIDEVAVITKKPYKPLWLMVYKTPTTVGEALEPPIIKHKFSTMDFIAITSLDP